MRTRALGLAALSLLSFAASAFGQDAAEDPAALFRRARAAESVERDPAKAIELYRKVMATAPGADAARDAGLRLLELLETRGEKAAAIEVANTLTERFTSRLDDEGKRRVHEALARMLPAGSKARSPLGDVYVVPSGSGTTSPGSPLEAKVLAMLEKGQDPKAEEGVLHSLAFVGRDAMPILERALRTERLERAQFAARSLARIGGAGAIELLAKAAREGDGFTRSAALRGLQEIKAKPEVSPLVVRAIDPLYADPALEDVRSALRNLLWMHLSDDELLARHAAGGPDASTWLRAAVLRQNPEALKRIEVAAREGAPIDQQLIQAFVEAAGSRDLGANDDGPTFEILQSNFPEEARLRMLRVLAAQKASAETVWAVAGIAAACMRSSSADLRASAARAAWEHVLSSEDGTVRATGVGRLVTMAVPIPASITNDETKTRAIVDTLEVALRAGLSPHLAYQRAALTTEPLRANAGYWRGIAASTLSSPLRMVLMDLGKVAPVEQAPAELDATWLSLVSNEIKVIRFDAWTQWMLRAASRKNDPALIEAVRRVLPSRNSTIDAYLRVLAEAYHGPGLAALALDRVEQEKRLTGTTSLILKGARESGAIWPEFAQIAESGSSERMHAMGMVVNDGERWAPPASFGPKWIAALRRTDAPVQHEAWSTIAEWAAASGSSEFPVVVRERLQSFVDPGFSLQHTVEMALATELADTYEGPDRLDVLGELVRRRNLHVELAKPLVKGLAEPPPRGFPATIIEVASHPELPASSVAVAWLGNNGRQAELAAIVKAATAASLPDDRYARALADSAMTMHLADAIPWLLRVVKEGHSAGDDAATAIDNIHSYHARIAKFESYRGAGVDPRQAIEAHLADADPTIRRAAVVALAALADRDALPRLLTVAKEEKDASVRAAALEAIERISKSPPRTPSPVPAPESPAME